MGRKNKRKKSEYGKPLHTNKYINQIGRKKVKPAQAGKVSEVSVEKQVSTVASGTAPVSESIPASGKASASAAEFAHTASRCPQRGDIWFAELGKHPGTSVQEGCRPVFIVSNDIANGHSGTLTVVPMTSRKKKVYLPTHVLMEPSDCINLEPSMALAEQLTTIGKSALKSYVGHLKDCKIHEIEKAVEVHLGLEKAE